MRLAKITAEEKSVKVTLTMPKHIKDTVDDYRSYYEHFYKEKISNNALMIHMLDSFMKKDRDFIKYRNQKKR